MAVVDFVLVSVLLTLLFLGVIQLALALHVRNVVVDAASEGARHGGLAGHGPADATARTGTLIEAALSEGYAADVSAEVEVIEGVDVVAVTVRGPLPVVGLIGPRRLAVTGHAVDEDGL